MLQTAAAHQFPRPPVFHDSLLLARDWTFDPGSRFGVLQFRLICSGRVIEGERTTIRSLCSEKGADPAGLAHVQRGSSPGVPVFPEKSRNTTIRARDYQLLCLGGTEKRRPVRTDGLDLNGDGWMDRFGD